MFFFIAVLVFAGLLAGTLAGLFGIGGGLVFVPVLFFVFSAQGCAQDLAMSLAVSTSLATILFSSLSSSISHWKLKNVDADVLKLWVVPMVLGVVLASQWVKPQHGNLLILVFISLLFVVALRLFIKVDEGRSSAQNALKIAYALPLAFSIGGISVMAGVGGGALSVPSLILLGRKAHRAVGTSAVLGLAITLPSSLLLALGSESVSNAPAFTWGQINLAALLVLAPCSALMAPLGAKFAQKLPAQLLTRLFASCLLTVAAAMLWRYFT